MIGPVSEGLLRLGYEHERKTGKGPTCFIVSRDVALAAKREGDELIMQAKDWNKSDIFEDLEGMSFAGCLIVIDFNAPPGYMSAGTTEIQDSIEEGSS